MSSSRTTVVITLLTRVIDLGRVRYRCFDGLARRTVVVASGGECQSSKWKDRQEAAENHRPLAEE